jgi:hypothetical protein
MSTRVTMPPSQAWVAAAAEESGSCAGSRAATPVVSDAERTSSLIVEGGMANPTSRDCATPAAWASWTASCASARDSSFAREVLLSNPPRFRTVLLPALLLAASACSVTPAAGTDAPPAEQDGGTVLVGAGDIATCRNSGAEQTARLLDGIPGIVFVAGDAGYETRRVRDPLRACFEPTWGRHKGRIRAVIGNHDDDEAGSRKYFDYFGDAGGPRPHGYYSFDAGDWHVVALNSNIDMRHGSPQDRWLNADLAANRGKCAVAIVHHAIWSSGRHGSQKRGVPLWETLQNHGVSVVLAGHDHVYERFRRQRVDGTEDAERGMRTFIVGTGGAGHYRFGRIERGSEVRNNDTYGVLKLTLLRDRYRWEFVPVAGRTFRDRGENRCQPLR